MSRNRENIRGLNPVSKIMLQTIRAEKHWFLGQMPVSHLLVPPNCCTAHSALKEIPIEPMVLDILNAPRGSWHW